MTWQQYANSERGRLAYAQEQIRLLNESVELQRRQLAQYRALYLEMEQRALAAEAKLVEIHQAAQPVIPLLEETGATALIHALG